MGAIAKWISVELVEYGHGCFEYVPQGNSLYAVVLCTNEFGYCLRDLIACLLS